MANKLHQDLTKTLTKIYHPHHTYIEHNPKTTYCDFLCIFQHGTNFLPFRKLKKLNQSENPRQPHTVTNATTNVQKHTTVRNFLPYGTFLKGDTP